MKILSAEKIREADQYTIEHEPISAVDLMERAATQLFTWFTRNIEKENNLHIFCGIGNNGGDGLVLSRLLLEEGYTVTTWIVLFSEQTSPSFDLNLQRLREIKGAKVEELREETPLPKLLQSDIIVDSLFGSGLSRGVSGFPARVIAHINQSRAFVVAVDLPSGLFCDSSSRDRQGAIVEAAYTLTFQFPKFSFFFAENDPYLGEWEILDIGLHPQYIMQAENHNFFIESEFCQLLMRPRHKYDHKGIYGHGLLIAGSMGKSGAAVLAAHAALRSGAGLITAHLPQKSLSIMQTALPEAMCSTDPDPHAFSTPPDLTPYKALAIGPGLGKATPSAQALKTVMEQAPCPLIFDADALNILSEHKTWFSLIPPKSIFTPHPTEFTRLVGPSENNFHRHDQQLAFSKNHDCYVILKGAHTVITTPEGKAYFNSSGNPGMATGGSGDVLTGILLGLLTRGYTPLEASILGVFLHGLAGDIAADELGEESLIASDIIQYLPNAFTMLHQ